MANKNPRQALVYWSQIAATDSNFPDSQGVADIAQAMFQQQKQKGWRDPLLALVGIVLVLLLIYGMSNLLDGNGKGDGIESITSSTIPSSIPISTTTGTVTPTEAVTLTRTYTEIPTQTAVPTRTPSPTATFTPGVTLPPENMAVVNENASIFAQPNATTTEINVVMADEMVTIIGRADNSNWLFVQDAEGNVGFVFIDLLTWNGDLASLLIRAGNVSDPTQTPIFSEPFSLDIYRLDGTESCNGSVWTQSVYMRAQGVSGTFEYYWEGELVGTAVNDNITFEVDSDGGAIVGTGSVIVSGTTVSKEIFIPAPSCSNDSD